MKDFNDTPLWLFSLNFYSLKGVRESLLAFQDFSGANVNILLLLLWLASRRRSLSLNEVDEIIGSTNSWNKNVVIPLRKIRQNLKKNDEGIVSENSFLLREKIKILEFEAEKIEQRALFDAYNIRSFGKFQTEIGAAARTNLKTYEQLLETSFPEPNFEFIVETMVKRLH